VRFAVDCGLVFKYDRLDIMAMDACLPCFCAAMRKRIPVER
jgi:hypothetical protein